MSADHLPEDLRRWPRDPYQVLGITSGCDPLEARKAYTRLIRQFKPEQFPEQFRLIREAYDAVKFHLQYFGQPATAAPGQDNSDGSASTTRPAVDGLQIAWDQACNGQEDEAYRRLRELYDMNPQDSELPIRLYALLLANPDLDAVRTRHDFLVRGIRSEGGYWGRCGQLYRREIDDYAEEALSERFMNLIDSVDPVRNVLGFLIWRWEALQRLDRVEFIESDLSRVGPRLSREDEEVWVRVMLKAADYLAWHPSSDFVRIREEIEHRGNMHAALREDLSRLDFLQELYASWHRLTRGWTGRLPLLKAAPMCWTNPYENRQRILSHCRAVAENPEAALEQLDEVHDLAPLVTAHLGQTLPWLFDPAADPRDEHELSAVMAEYLGGVDFPVARADYAHYRKHLLRLCLSQIIAPEAVASMLFTKSAPLALQLVLDDWPLRAVCAVHRLIWATG
jgi:hypothetical protein